jgi:hypothetical protein
MTYNFNSFTQETWETKQQKKIDKLENDIAFLKSNLSKLQTQILGTSSNSESTTDGLFSNLQTQISNLNCSS